MNGETVVDELACRRVPMKLAAASQLLRSFTLLRIRPRYTTITDASLINGNLWNLPETYTFLTYITVSVHGQPRVILHSSM